MVSGGAAFTLGRQQNLALAQQIGWPLWSMIGGLVAYIYFTLGLPGTAVVNDLHMGSGFLVTVGGGLIGLLAFWVWQKMN